MKRFLLLALTLCLFGVTAFAQSQTGNLVGTVSDPSGVIPGATVVVTSNVTGQEKTVVSTDSGSFNVPQLDVGTYTVKITAAGHKTFTVTDVKIDIGKDYNLNGRQIVELPLNGRNPLSLVLLQAGTSSNSAQNTTINGQRSSFTNVTRDGINVQDNFIRANAVDFLPDRPSVDDTGEFTIVTQNAGAEAGYGASQIQLVTPRGSNEFHGAIYEYNRNSKFAANTYFNNFQKVARPFLNRNQFGGRASGPILKNKLFFFAGYEGFRLRQSTTVNRTILLPNARTGLFTFTDNSGAVRTINIFTAAAAGIPAPAPGSPALPGGIDPVIQARILAALPTAGNNPTLGDQLNTTGLSFSRSTPQDREGFTTRIDFDLNSENTINGVYSYKKELLSRNDLEAQQGGTACCFTDTPYGFQDAHTQFIALAWRWSPTATLTNEVRGGGQLSDPAFGNTFTRPDFYFRVPLINNTEPAFDP
ncbi:MAG: carboxypeptidase-like regulatory domain-containing protein, partial [Acidobacteria bacterium]|nr:carboxypeptidase-like regulatory domain-containing protein [Acidobacteriota bacterium]